MKKLGKVLIGALAAVSMGLGLTGCPQPTVQVASLTGIALNEESGIKVEAMKEATPAVIKKGDSVKVLLDGVYSDGTTKAFTETEMDQAFEKEFITLTSENDVLKLENGKIKAVKGTDDAVVPCKLNYKSDVMTEALTIKFYVKVTEVKLVGIALSEDGDLDPEATAKTDAQTLKKGKKYEILLVGVYSDGTKKAFTDSEMEKAVEDYITVKFSNNENEAGQTVLSYSDGMLKAADVSAAGEVARCKINYKTPTMAEPFYINYYAKVVASVTEEFIELKVDQKSITKSVADDVKTVTVNVEAVYALQGNKAVTATSSSSNTAVATVSGNTITIVGAGDAEITFSYTDTGVTKTQTVTVKVTAADVTLKSIAITNTSTTVATKNNVELKAVAVYSDGSKAAIVPVYTSDNAAGVITGSMLANKNETDADVTVTVTATYEGKTTTKSFVMQKKDGDDVLPNPIVTEVSPAVGEVAVPAGTKVIELVVSATASNPSGKLTYQWFKGTTPIDGATHTTLEVTESGVYKCRVTETVGTLPGDTDSKSWSVVFPGDEGSAGITIQF